MASTALSLSRYLFMLRNTKRWWVPLLIVTVAGINVAGLFLPRKYESQAIVVIHEPNVQFISSVSNDVLTVEDRLRSIREQITSRDFLKLIAAKANLDAGIPPDTPRYQELLAEMTDSIDLRVKEQSHFSLAYRADTPQHAYDVTREIVDLFIRTSTEYYASRARQLENLVQIELNEAQLQLKAIQQQVIQFENEHFNEIPEAQERHMKLLDNLVLRRQNDMLQLKALNERLDLARKRVEKMDPNLPTAEPAEGQTGLQKLKDEKKALEVKLSMMLNDFTTSHPQVINMERQIAEAGRLIEEMSSQPAKGQSALPNREYADLATQIAALEIEERRLKDGIAECEQQMQVITGYLANIPKNKGPLELMKNEMRQKEERVNRLIRQLDEAKVTGAIEQKGLGPSFEETEYPRLSMIPVSPNRKKIGALSAGMGLMAALGLVYLFTVFDTVVRSMDEARGMLQMPILGVVQRIITPAEEALQRRRRRRRIWGTGALLALGCAAAVVGVVFFREWLEHTLSTVRNIVNQW